MDMVGGVRKLHIEESKDQDAVVMVFELDKEYIVNGEKSRTVGVIVPNKQMVRLIKMLDGIVASRMLDRHLALKTLGV